MYVLYSSIAVIGRGRGEQSSSYGLSALPLYGEFLDSPIKYSRGMHVTCPLLGSSKCRQLKLKVQFLYRYLLQKYLDQLHQCFPQCCLLFLKCEGYCEPLSTVSFLPSCLNCTSNSHYSRTLCRNIVLVCIAIRNVCVKCVLKTEKIQHRTVIEFFDKKKNV